MHFSIAFPCLLLHPPQITAFSPVMLAEWFLKQGAQPILKDQSIISNMDQAQPPALQDSYKVPKS